MKLKQSKLKLTKKSTIIIAASLVLLAALLIFIYIRFSLSTWQDYNTANVAWVKSAQREIDQAVERPLGENLSASDKRQGLANLASQQVRDSGTICRPPASVAWQSDIGEIGKLIAQCNQRADSVRSEARSVQKSLEYLQTEAKLAKMLTAANSSATKSQTDAAKWPEVEATWRQLADSIKKMNGDNQFQEVQDVAAERSLAIADGWRDLIAANKAEDQAKFVEARASLEEAYAALKDLDAASQKLLP